MADKIKDFTSKMGKGGAGMPGAPKGLGLGMKVLAAGIATVYGINESMYTVDGGHRAIIFDRISGIDVYS